MKQYCPFCQRDIEASNTKEVEAGECGEYIFVHDDVPHDEDYNYTDLHQEKKC